MIDRPFDRTHGLIHDDPAAVELMEFDPVILLRIRFGFVITFMRDGSQKVALAAGFNSPARPTRQTNAKIYGLGLEEAAGQ